MSHTILAFAQLIGSIDLGHNHFTGVLASEIGHLRRLDYLSLNNNDFKGPLPTELGLLTSLSKFNRVVFMVTLLFVSKTPNSVFWKHLF